MDLLGLLVVGTPSFQAARSDGLPPPPGRLLGPPHPAALRGPLLLNCGGRSTPTPTTCCRLPACTVGVAGPGQHLPLVVDCRDVLVIRPHASVRVTCFVLLILSTPLPLRCSTAHYSVTFSTTPPCWWTQGRPLGVTACDRPPPLALRHPVLGCLVQFAAVRAQALHRAGLLGGGIDFLPGALTIRCWPPPSASSCSPA